MSPFAWIFSSLGMNGKTQKCGEKKSFIISQSKAQVREVDDHDDTAQGNRSATVLL